MVPWWLPVDLPNILANIDCLEMWLTSIERSFQGLSVAIKTVRIDEELMEIWPNEVCDIDKVLYYILYYLYYFYMVCVLKSCGHMSFWNILLSPDLIMWYGLLKFPALFIVLSCCMPWDCLKVQEVISFLGLS